MYNPQLDTFIQVAESGSFSAAAQELFITPTAVIKQMNLLEGRMGVVLFNRSHRGLTLTKAGESLLVDARHIVQYSQEAKARARAAERGEKRVVRVGVSLLTPATRLADALAAVRLACPGMSVQLVTYENSPQSARNILGNLGRDIDVVAGIFDDGLLREHGCAGLPLESMPIRCAVPVDDPLARCDVVSPADLAGRRLMLIRRGWNVSMDALRDELWNNHSDITVEDFPRWMPEVFNEAVTEGRALASLDLWEDVHPMLRTLPATWDHSVTFGIMHADEPAPHVREFLEALDA